MKKKFCAIVVVVAPLLKAVAIPDLELYNAMRQGAEVNIALRVVDSRGAPVPQARLHGGLQTGDGLDDFSSIEGQTDTNGIYTVSGICTHRLRCRISKPGYYPSECLMMFPVKGAVPQVLDGKWQPFGAPMTVVLKELRMPGRLCAFPDSLRNCRIPAFDEWLGFDFEHADWTTPYGKGHYRDVLLRFSAEEKSMTDYKYVMEVSFTNNPYAGAYMMKADLRSKLTTAYVADSNATFQTSFCFKSTQSPGRPRCIDILNRDSYLVFRTRTRVDEYGRLAGAHYGKILGRWLSDTEFMILSDGCFNPVENDVNIEDGQSLRHDLKNK
jgi:hypothetical protein